MTAFAQPFHLVYLNRDYNESLHPVRTPRDVVITLAQELDVGVFPSQGVGDAFWSGVRKAFEQNWKGASAFHVTGTGPEVLQPVDEIHLTPDELSQAVINAHLTGNPDQPVYAVLMNKDSTETAVILNDRREVISTLIEMMEVDTAEIEFPDDFVDSVQRRFARGGWTGLLIASVHPQTLEYELLDLKDLGFSMEDLAQGAPEQMGP